MSWARIEPVLTAFLLAAAFLVGLAILGLGDWHVFRASGFGHSNNCFYSLLGKDVERRSVLLLGSSRMRQNLDPDGVAAALGLPGEAALDFGHPERDMAMDVDLLREFASRTRLRLAVVELHVGSSALAAVELKLDPILMPPPLRLSGDEYSDRRVLVARHRDLILAASRQPAAAGLYDAANAEFRKIDRTIKLLASRNWIATWKKPDPSIDQSRTNVCYPAPGSGDAYKAADAALLKRFRDRFGAAMLARWDAPDLLTAAASAPARDAVEQMVGIAREHGFALVFVYLPSAYLPLPPPEFEQAFAARYGVPLIVPDRRLIYGLSGTHYSDNAHLDTEGRALLTAQLVPHLAKAALAR